MLLILAGFITIIAMSAALWLIFDLFSRLQSFVGGAPWVPLENEVAAKMWELAELKPGETVMDLGCGDARHLIFAVQKYRVQGIGVEVATAPLLLAHLRIAKAGVENKLKLIRKNLLHVDPSEADVIFLYLTPKLLKIFTDKLMPQTKQGARIVVARFPLPTSGPALVDTATHHPIYLYN